MVAVPKEWAGQRVLLHFGAVDWEVTVWLNGKKLGEHRGGYDGFTFDIADAVDPKKADQELIVGVFDPTDADTQPRGKQVKHPGGIFYTSDYRHLANRLDGTGSASQHRIAQDCAEPG